MADDRTLGQHLHESRIRHNPPAERPRGVAPWDQRAPWQRDLDEAMAADVEAEVRRRVTAEQRDRASRRWPPGFYRDELYAAADAVARGGQDRTEAKEPG